jgi:hypothetical protein
MVEQVKENDFEITPQDIEFIKDHGITVETVDDKEVLSINLPERFFPKIEQWQNEWREEFDRRIPQPEDYAYVLHPKTSGLMKALFPYYAEIYENHIPDLRTSSEWAEGKTHDVGQRVFVPDAYWLVSTNAKIVAEKAGSMEKDHVRVRSLFGGAGVYERSVFEFLEDPSNISLLTTDVNPYSCLRIGLNMALYNVGKPESRKISNYIVNGTVPAELLERKGCCVVQISEALESMRNQHDDCDIFTVDNGLPYIDQVDAYEILALGIETGAKMIQFLDLNKVRVKVSPLFQVSNILRGSNAARFEEILAQEDKVSGGNYPFEYRHKYVFGKDGLITEVYTPQGAALLDWIHDLIFSGNIPLALNLIKKIKVATGLSDLSAYIKSTMRSIIGSDDVLANREVETIRRQDPSWTEPVVLSTTTVVLK